MKKIGNLKYLNLWNTTKTINLKSYVYSDKCIFFFKVLRGIEMIELTSSHGHTQVTTYREIISENDLKVSREIFLQLKI